jgi:hypothetical protein
MYAQSRYQQEEIDRAQAEAEKMYSNKNEDYNSRDYRRGERDDRDRRYEERESRRRSVDHYDEFDHEERRTHMPVHVPVPVPTHTHVPVHVYAPVSVAKKYRTATYDKHDKIFAKQMRNFKLPPEFNTFTDGLLTEAEISRARLLEAIADYNKTGSPSLPEEFQKAAEHCRKYRAVKYDIHDQTYAKQMQFYELPPEFSEFTDGLLKETHINRFNLLEAIDNYNAKGLPDLPCVFQDVAFNCRPYQPCVIC